MRPRRAADPIHEGDVPPTDPHLERNLRERVRSPNLDARRIKAILGIIHRLPGRPGWEAVISAIELKLDCRYTRQTLFAHPAIRLAYQERKAGAAARPGERPISAIKRAAADEKIRLRTELAEVKRREELLLERIANWIYNAHANGIPLGLLDAKPGRSRAEAAGAEMRPRKVRQGSRSDDS